MGLSGVGFRIQDSGFVSLNLGRLYLHVKPFRMLGLSARVAYSLSGCCRVFVLAEPQQASCKRACRIEGVGGC